MILADKIIQLRKKSGWSQEELAEKLGVSRQAVSKWEGAQATPDLSKLLAMSQLFGVTTDFLLKDSMETEEWTEDAGAQPLRRLSIQEANDFLARRDRASLLIAGGVMLCMLGVMVLIGLLAVSQFPSAPLSQETASGLGVGALLVCAAAAVILFVYCGRTNSAYEFLDREDFISDYGVEGLARKRKQEEQKTHTLLLCVGIALCVLSPVPLIVGVLLSDADALVLVGVLLLMCGLGAALCTVAGVRRAAVDKLLKEGDYSARGKRISGIVGPIGTVYWLLVTAAFLAWSFLGDAWSISWVLWPVAGVLYGAIHILCVAVADRRGE